MRRTLRITPAATRDITSAFQWYEREQQGLGERFLHEVDTAMMLMLQLGSIGPIVHRDVRRLLIRRFPFALYFTVSAEDIVVRGCVHQRRNLRGRTR